MKLPWDKKYVVKGIIAFLVVIASISFYMMMTRWETFRGFLSLLNTSLKPITYGLVLAYLLNPLVRVLEEEVSVPVLKKIFRKNQGRAVSFARGSAITASWVIVFVLLFALMDLVIPELYSSIEALAASLPGYINTAFTGISELLEKNPEVVSYLQKNIAGFTTDLEEVIGRITSIIPNINIVITQVFSNVFDFLKAVFNVLIGVIVSVYVLKDKEKFACEFKDPANKAMIISSCKDVEVQLSILESANDMDEVLQRVSDKELAKKLKEKMDEKIKAEKLIAKELKEEMVKAIEYGEVSIEELIGRKRIYNNTITELGNEEVKEQLAVDARDKRTISKEQKEVIEKLQKQVKEKGKTNEPSMDR